MFRRTIFLSCLMASALTAQTTQPAAAPTTISVQTIKPATQPATQPNRPRVRPPTSRPTTRPTTLPTTKPAAEVSPDAKVLLDKLNAAYAAIQDKPQALACTIIGEFDVAGRSRNYELKVVGYTDGKGHFDHQSQGAGRIVQTDDQFIVYDVRRNAYGTISQTPAIRDSKEIPAAATDVLIDENPSLLMLIARQPAELLKLNAARIKVQDGMLLIESESTLRTIEISADGLITGMTLDYTPILKSRGAQGINKATVRLKYQTDGVPPVSADQFIYEPPSDAILFQLQSELMKSLPPGTRINRVPAGPSTQPGTSE